MKKVVIRQFQEYLQIFVDDVLFWEGRRIIPRVLQTLLLYMGHNAKIEVVKDEAYAQEGT
jgi:hypothetical protein